MSAASTVSGCLFGLALGDALAAPVEFDRDIEKIQGIWGIQGPTEPLGNPAEVTDDTQMALAVADALIAAGPDLTPARLERELTAAFVEWMRMTDAGRAPGITCMTACRALAAHLPWRQATIGASKGCGANMRVAPVGLLNAPAATRSGIAQLQAALTHGHPTALAASDLTARAVTLLAEGAQPGGLVRELRAYAASQRGNYPMDWLGSLWEVAGASGGAAYSRAGWDVCLVSLESVQRATDLPSRITDPCLATGEGWIAEEAFATGLLCFLLFPDDPVAALRRAALTSGDSDSIACLTGAFAGAHHGIEAWPADWVRRIEYRDRIARLSTQLSA